jgi:hypothetical protein
MANEHNGNLIAALYAASDTRSVIKVLEEMDEIKDLSFVAPIIVAYGRYKGSSISHYFVSSLKRYSSPQVKEKLIEIALNPSSEDRDFIWAIDYLTEIKFNDERIVQRIIKYLISQKDFSGFEMEAMADYLNFVGKLEIHQDIFLAVIKNPTIDRDARKYAIRALFKLDATKFLQYFIDNFEETRKTFADNMLAEVLTSWTGTIVTKLEDKILSEGNDRAKDLITAKRIAKEKSVKKEEEKKAESLSSEYSNADIVTIIHELKKSINIISLSDAEIGFALLPDSDNLISQIKSANSEPDLINAAILLRSEILSFDEKIKDHGFDLAGASKVIPDTGEKEMQSPLNRLQLFMTSRGKPVDKDLFGLRKLSLLPNKVAHPDDKQGLVEALTKNNLLAAYKANDWKKIHRDLLESYRQSLLMLQKSLQSIPEKG